MNTCENKECNYDGREGWLISDPVCCPECKMPQIKCHCETCEKLSREAKVD